MVSLADELNAHILDLATYEVGHVLVRARGMPPIAATEAPAMVATATALAGRHAANPSPGEGGGQPRIRCSQDSRAADAAFATAASGANPEKP